MVLCGVWKFLLWDKTSCAVTHPAMGGGQGAAAAPGEQWQMCRCELAPESSLQGSGLAGSATSHPGHADIPCVADGAGG